MCVCKAYIFGGFLTWDLPTFNIRYIWRWNMTWVCKNAHKEREKEHKSQYGKNGGIQGARWAPQTDPIFYKHEDRNVIHESHQRKHGKDRQCDKSFAIHHGCGVLKEVNSEMLVGLKLCTSSVEQLKRYIWTLRKIEPRNSSPSRIMLMFDWMK